MCACRHSTALGASRGCREIGPHKLTQLRRAVEARDAMLKEHKAGTMERVAAMARPPRKTSPDHMAVEDREQDVYVDHDHDTAFQVVKAHKSSSNQKLSQKEEEYVDAVQLNLNHIVREEAPAIDQGYLSPHIVLLSNRWNNPKKTSPAVSTVAAFNFAAFSRARGVLG